MVIFVNVVDVHLDVALFKFAPINAFIPEP